jgi:hypothetical protein
MFGVGVASANVLLGWAIGGPAGGLFWGIILATGMAVMWHRRMRQVESQGAVELTWSEALQGMGDHRMLLLTGVSLVLYLGGLLAERHGVLLQAASGLLIAASLIRARRSR